MRSIVSSALLLPIGLAIFFLLYLVLARALSPEEYGKFNFIISVSSFLAILLGAGLPVATTKFIPQYLARGEYKLVGGYLAWGLTWVICISVAVSIILYATSSFVSNQTIRDYCIYFSITIPPIMLWQWQRYSSLGFDFVATAILPRDIIYPIIALIGLYFLNIKNAGEALFLLNGIYLISLIFGLVILFRKKPNTASLNFKDFSERKTWHKTSFPMVFSILVQLGLNNWDLILLGLLSTMENAGLYAVATRIAMFISLVIRVFDTAISQKISKLYTAKKYLEMKSTYKHAKYASSMIGILGFTIILIFHSNILSLFGEKYKDMFFLLFILSSAHLSLSLTGPVLSTLNMIDQQNYVARSLLRWSIISLVLNAITIPFFTFYGAAFTFLFCTAGLRIEQYLKLQNIFKNLI